MSQPTDTDPPTNTAGTDADANTTNTPEATTASHTTAAQAAHTRVPDASDIADDSAPDLAPDIETETDTTAALLDENARLRDALARSLADLDNYRRRVNREKEDLRKYAAQKLIEDLIPIADNFSIGLAAAAKHPEAAPVVAGFKMISEQIKRALEQHGLREISPLGEPFDPHSHESVSQTAHDTIPEQHVAAVLRTGYSLHDRLVRPAAVVLSTGPATATPAATAAAPAPTNAAPSPAAPSPAAQTSGASVAPTSGA
ncbi:MAG: nucleotide exchange factor GrpE [Puniceicoccales bacterium]|nr:nucleotide exchange factor GrpE [Puniceicoccales bacterium]